MLPSYRYRVKEIVRVIDGDTVDVIIDLGFNILTKERIRLIGIDTDELRGGTMETKIRANAASKRIEELLNMGDVIVETEKDKTGKYGRMLGRFFVYSPKGDKFIDVSRTLLTEGYEKGGTGINFNEKLVFVNS